MSRMIKLIKRKWEGAFSSHNTIKFEQEEEEGSKETKKIYSDQVDGKDEDEILKIIGDKANNTSRYLRNKLTKYIAENFHMAGSGPYDTPLVFGVFEDPPKSEFDPTKDMDYLEAVKRILVNASRLMAPVGYKDDAVKETLVEIASVEKMLDQQVTRLALNPEQVKWHPDDQVTLLDLGAQADMVDRSLWPVLLKGGGSVGETRKKLINFTFIKQMDFLMIDLCRSAECLTT